MVIFTWSVTLELLFNGIPISDIVKLLLHLPGILVVSSAGNALIILLLRRLNDMIREIMDASGVELVLIGPGSVDQVHAKDDSQLQNSVLWK
ncbi:thioredoxin-like protein AAED1, chloroplastic isoform X11 [Euphorbia lathyris]|uniref:thioredoxin-like protein AAED1, chloroplastic isoform X11 n=1 Tax=Euphorbia lathyris TaxID=212925 RepID=UPI00331328B7